MAINALQKAAQNATNLVFTEAYRRQMTGSNIKALRAKFLSSLYTNEPLPPTFVTTTTNSYTRTLDITIDIPSFVHDCNECVFLGLINKSDAYVCNKQPWQTLILRYGDNPGDYDSTPIGLLDVDDHQAWVTTAIWRMKMSSIPVATRR